MRDTAQRSLPVWAIYFFMSVCFVFTSYVPNVSLLWVVMIIAGYIVRAIVRKASAELEVGHTSWQIRTLWLWLCLFCLLVVATLGAVGVVGSDEVLAQANALAENVQNGSSTPMEMLTALWKIQSLKTTLCVVIVFGMLFAIWPLKRTLHGAMAMYAGLAPSELPASRGWAALGFAVLLQVIFPFVVLVLFTN